MADGKETQRSLAAARKRWPGSAGEKVEWWDPFASTAGPGRSIPGRRHDLFGFADVLVDGPESGTIYIQVTTRKQMSKRRGKIYGKKQSGETSVAAQKRQDNVRSVLAGGSRILVQGWDQPSGPGTRWIMTEWEILEENMP